MGPLAESAVREGGAGCCRHGVFSGSGEGAEVCGRGVERPPRRRGEGVRSAGVWTVSAGADGRTGGEVAGGGGEGLAALCLEAVYFALQGVVGKGGEGEAGRPVDGGLGGGQRAGREIDGEAAGAGCGAGAAGAAGAFRRPGACRPRPRSGGRRCRSGRRRLGGAIGGTRAPRRCRGGGLRRCGAVADAGPPPAWRQEVVEGCLVDVAQGVAAEWGLTRHRLQCGRGIRRRGRGSRRLRRRRGRRG
jgi:hypothetical protein